MIQFNRIPVNHLKPVWLFAHIFCKMCFPPFLASVYSLQISCTIGCDDDDCFLNGCGITCAFFTSQCKAWHKFESAYFDMSEKLCLPSLRQIGNVSQLIFNSSWKISVGGCQRVCAHICECKSLTLLLRSFFSVIGMRPITFIHSIVSWNPAKVSTKYAYSHFILSVY